MPFQHTTSFNIGGRQIAIHPKTRIIMVDDFIIQLTPTEYQLLLCLIDGEIIVDTELARRALNATHFDKWVKATLEKHIENVRNKLKPTNLNIFRVLRLGYVLRPETDPTHLDLMEQIGQRTTLPKIP